MSKCSCGAPATINLSYTDRVYCCSCFETYIEKRVRKNIRLHKDIEPLDTIYVYDDGSKEHTVAKRFLQRVFEKNITVRTTQNEEVNNGKIVYPTNMDREISDKLRQFLDNSFKEDCKIKLLDNVLEEEIVQLCECWNIKASQEENVHTLIEQMENKYPDAKFSLRSAFQKIKEQHPK